MRNERFVSYAALRLFEPSSAATTSDVGWAKHRGSRGFQRSAPDPAGLLYADHQFAKCFFLHLNYSRTAPSRSRLIWREKK